MSQNPLQHLYRSKTVFVSLPSSGKYYPSGIEVSLDGELGLMPMTTADEIKLKSPDALFNGEAMFDMIKSCAPDIKNPKEIPACDLDVILFGIRIATSGDMLEISSKCPHCEEAHDYEVNLPVIMSTAVSPDLEDFIQINENTKVYVRPYSLQSQIKSNIKQFYQYRMEATLNHEDMDTEKKAELFNNALASASAITVELCASNILKVELTDEEGKVTEVNQSKHIFEWVNNMDSATYKKIITRIRELGDAKIQNETQINCAGCEKPYKTVIDLDPITFFT
jgi:hypothetical protein